MSERNDLFEKIEAELDKPVAERNQDKLTFWQDQLDKIPVAAQGKRTSSALIHRSSPSLPVYFHLVFLHVV
jgi:hypothetical protein